MTAPENVSMETLNSEIQGLLGAMFRPVEFHGEDAEACAYMYSAVRALLLYVSNQSRSGALGSTDTANINRNVTACVQDVRALRDQFSVLQRNMNEVYAMASQNSQSPQRQDSINVGQRHEGVEGQVKNIQQALNLTEQRIRDLSIRYEQDLTDLQSEQRRGTDFRIALENRIGNVERSVADRFNAMQNDINRIVEQCEMVSHSNNRPIAQDHGPVFESMNARLEKIESRLEVVGTSKTDPKFTDTLHALIEENDSMKMTMSTFGERLELILHQVASSLQADIENLYAVWDLRKHEVAAICKSGNTRNKISLIHSTPAFSDLLSKNVSAMTAPGVPGMARSPRNSFMAQPLRSPRGNFAPGFGFGAQVNSAGSPRSPQGSFMGTPLSPRSSMQRQTRHVGIEVAPNKSGGVIVTRVVPNSAASEANIRIGDVLTAIEGNRVDDVSSMVEAVRKCVSLNSSFTVTRLPAGMNTIPENVRCVLK